MRQRRDSAARIKQAIPPGAKQLTLMDHDGNVILTVEPTGDRYAVKVADQLCNVEREHFTRLRRYA